MLPFFPLSSIYVYHALFMDPKSYFRYFSSQNNNPRTTINCTFSFNNNISLCRIVNIIMNWYQSFKFYHLDSSIVQNSSSRFTISYVIVDPEVQIHLHFPLSWWMFQTLDPWCFGLIASCSPKKDHIKLPRWEPPSELDYIDTSI